MDTQLLCTFSTKDEVENDIIQIRETYNVVYKYIYILQNKANLDELFITYNIDTEYKPHLPLRNTILVHRKKQFNTLYTINVLNELVRAENGGVLDKSFMIDWSNYRNSIIVTNSSGLKKISTRIFEIIDLSTN